MPDAAALTDETDALGPIQPPAPPNNADITPFLNQAKTNLGTSQQRMGPLLQQREQALGDVGGATQQYQQAAQGIPKPPQQQAPPNGGIDFNNASMWLMGATVLGAIAGSLTRRHVTNSLAAFTGALQGLKEGNQIKFERETKVWEEQNRLADQQYKYARDAYQSILENKKFDITTKSYMVEQTAMQIKDEQMQQAAAQRDIITMTGLMDARQREYDKSRQAFIGTMRQMEQMKQRQDNADRSFDQRERRMDMFTPDQMALRKADRDFSTGPQGNTIRSFSVAMSHMDTLQGLADAMKNGNVQAINAAKNKWQSEFGSPAPDNLNLATQIVGDEVVKAVLGSSAGAAGDRERLQAAFVNATKSPEQISGALDTARALMAGQLNGLKQQYMQTTKNSGEEFDKRLSPSARQRLLGQSEGGGAQQRQGGSAPPQVGEVRKGYRFKGGDPADKASWEAVGNGA